MNVKCNLIVDLNYILMRAVYSLSKSNMLYGNLGRALETSVLSYKRWFPFEKVYLVSDSKEKSWRKSLYEKYKENRKKDSDIDWEFVYASYSEFKEYIGTKGFKILETNGIEGDDWIAYITEMSNSKCISNIIVSNDYDIKQLLRYDINEDYINIMTNEIFNKTKLFMPRNYNIFLNKLKKFNNDDIFTLTSNPEFYKLILSFLEKHEVIEIDPVNALLIKIISGDTSDNIESVYTTYATNGRKRGVGEKGAESILEKYVVEFGDPLLDDPNLVDNLTDLVMEKRKVNSIYTDDIIRNINLNQKLVDLRLSNLPSEIVNKMRNKFDN